MIIIIIIIIIITIAIIIVIIIIIIIIIIFNDNFGFQQCKGQNTQSLLTRHEATYNALYRVFFCKSPTGTKPMRWVDRETSCILELKMN